jgi:hypothetical protein
MVSRLTGATFSPYTSEVTIDPDVERFLRTLDATPPTTPTPEAREASGGGASPPSEKGRAEGSCPNPFEFHWVCDTCNSKVMVTRHPCGKRFAAQCPVCALKWVRKNRAKYNKGWMARAMVNKTLKFITVTLVKTRERLTPSVIAGYWHQCRKALNRRGYKIEAHSWAAEAGEDGVWNHIHAIVDMPYVPQAELSSLWATITGDSFRVDIRPVWRVKQAVNYLAKYMHKIADHACEYDYDLQSAHLIGSHKVLCPEERVHNHHLCQCGEHKWIKINQEEAFAIAGWDMEILDFTVKRHRSDAESILKGSVGSNPP